MEGVTLPGVAYNDLSGHMVGRWSDIMLHPEDQREIRALRTDMDFRDVRCRREVFIRFYLFHLMYRAHPGCVYYLMPHLTEGSGMEEKLWFAFINGCTQNPVTTTLIYRRFGSAHNWTQQQLQDWFDAEWARLPFDTDRRYQKKEFPRAVETYFNWLDGRSQQEAFEAELVAGDGPRPEEANFDRVWKLIQSDAFWGFGRLGTWSYMEYLFIMGLPLEPSSMMLRDMSGSKSHRNGLAKVLGRDDLDWLKGAPFQGKYSPQVLSWLEKEADLLLEEVRERAVDWNDRANHPQIDMRHVSRFTFESALCTFKGWFRPNRRYANVYNDMLRDRIGQVQTLWPDEDLGVFWEARARYLPDELRVECCPDDPGLARPKQNHFRLTGRVPMMDLKWGVFKDHNPTWRTGK